MEEKEQDLSQKFLKPSWAELAACHIHCFLLVFHTNTLLEQNRKEETEKEKNQRLCLILFSPVPAQGDAGEKFPKE